MTAHDTIQAPLLKPIPAAPTSSQVVDLPSTFQGQLKTGPRGFDLPKNAMADNLNSSPRFKEKSLKVKLVCIVISLSNGRHKRLQHVHR